MIEDMVVSFEPGHIADELAARGGVTGSVARRDLERYYAALRAELQTVELGEAEAQLLCDVLKGTFPEPGAIHLLCSEVEYACRVDKMHEKWEVDATALIERLRSLRYAQVLAVVDAVERFWELLPHTGTVSERLWTVGLVKDR